MPLGGRKQRALLALLLLRANEAVSTERLVDELWGEHPPRTATTSLQNAVSQLRKLLGPDVLMTRPPGYVLEVDRDQLDLARFERLVARGARGRAARARAAAPRGARALARPAARRLGARDVRAGRDPPARGAPARRARGADRRRPRARRRRASSSAELEALVARAPAARAAARPADARALPLGPAGGGAQAYHDARRTLVDELGIEPGPALQELYGSILRQERSLDASRRPTLEDHYDEVLRALLAGRLVPVLGPAAGERRRRRAARDLLARALRARRPARSRPRLRRAVRRRAERGRAAVRRAAPRARPRLRAAPLHALARRAAAAAARTRRCRSS